MLKQSEVIQHFNSCSLEQLIAYNKLIVSHVRNLQTQKALEVTRKLSVGMNVYFNHSKTGEKIEGVITKINRKTINIKSSKVNWTVTASLVKTAA